MNSEGKETKCHSVFTGTNIVLTANDLNLSIFKPVWLCQFDILKQEEITESALISRAAIQIPTPNFHLVILPNRLQMAFTKMDETVLEDINRVFGGILRNLPHTPLTALGINFDFFVAPSDPSEFPEWNKKYFSSQCSLAVGSDQVARPRFGSYFSMTVENMRLKVDAKPVHGIQADAKFVEALKVAEYWMHFGFNYHKDLSPDKPAGDALDSLSKWSAVATHARSIINQIPAKL